MSRQGSYIFIISCATGYRMPVWWLLLASWCYSGVMNRFDSRTTTATTNLKKRSENLKTWMQNGILVGVFKRSSVVRICLFCFNYARTDAGFSIDIILACMKYEWNVIENSQVVFSVSSSVEETSRPPFPSISRRRVDQQSCHRSYGHKKQDLSIDTNFEQFCENWTDPTELKWQTQSTTPLTIPESNLNHRRKNFMKINVHRFATIYFYMRLLHTHASKSHPKVPVLEINGA
jgi:hypothetical protein